MFQLLDIQNELKAPKNQFNKFGNYKYRSCEDILEALKPILVKHCATMTIYDDIIPVGDRIYIKSTVELWLKKVDPDSANPVYRVSAFAREQETKKGMDASQITGAASSYARKYALNGLFLIDDNKDADSTENKEEGEGVEKDSRDNLEKLAKSVIEKSSWPEAKKKAVLSGMKKHSDSFLKLVIDGKA